MEDRYDTASSYAPSTKNMCYSSYEAMNTQILYLHTKNMVLTRGIIIFRNKRFNVIMYSIHKLLCKVSYLLNTTEIIL